MNQYPGDNILVNVAKVPTDIDVFLTRVTHKANKPDILYSKAYTQNLYSCTYNVNTISCVFVYCVVISML